MSIKSTSFKNLLLSVAGFTILYTPIQQSFAQNVLEEVVVTSRRYEESITDAPLAVAVMDNAYLAENRIDSITDILELSPGAAWNSFTKAQPGLALRGIQGGNFGNASLESAVQVVYDGVPATKAFMMTLPVYDLGRVEIMRGPQGTTFGRNATIGLMHFVAEKPSQEFSAEISGSAGTLDLLGTNAYINGAITDEISGRAAVYYQETDGTVEDRNTGAALEASETIAIRGSLLFEPSEDFSSYVKVEYVEDSELPTVRRGSECAGPWLHPVFFGGYVDDCDLTKADQDDSREWSVDREMLFITNENIINIGDVTVTNVNGFQDGQHLNVQDAFGTPFAIRDQIVSNDAQVLSTELRVDNHASGNQFRWLAGISYLVDNEDRVETNIGFPERGNCGGRFNGVDPTTNCPEWRLIQTGLAESNALGIFAELTYDITDQFTASLGGRYSEDSRTMDWDLRGWGEDSGLGGVGLGNGSRDCNANLVPDPQGRGNQNPPPGVTLICGTAANPMGFTARGDRSWDDFSIKGSLSYAFNDNNNFYFTYSEGFKAGGFQHDARNLDAFNLVIDNETVRNYELGWKGAYDSLIFAITAFIMEQENSQQGNLVAVGSGNANMVYNAPGIDNQGIELEATWATPIEGFSIGGNFGIYDSEFVEGSQVGVVFDQVSGALVPSGSDISGDRPQFSPDMTAALWGTYEFALEGGSSIRLRVDYSHRSDVWGRNGLADHDGLNIAGTAPMYLRPELDKIGFNASWTSADDRLTLAIWGRNLTDETDIINFGPGVGYIYNLGQAGPQGFRVRSRPVGVSGRRQLGGTITYRFN